MRKRSSRSLHEAFEALELDREIKVEAPDTEEQEVNYIELNKKLEEYKRLQEETAGIKQDREERKVYAGKTFNLLCVYMVCVGILLLMSGFSESEKAKFHLSDPVLIAILGTTTTNILGIFYFVANYLFPKRHVAGSEGTSSRSEQAKNTQKTQ